MWSVPASELSTACSAALVWPRKVGGSGGTLASGGLDSASAAVRSPVTPRRQADRLGTSTPNRVSMKRSSEVWSNVSEQT